MPSSAATGAQTVTNLLGNKLDVESAEMLAEVAKQKGISLCGIRRDQTTADFHGQGLQPPDAILLASDLSQAVVNSSLSKCDLRGNVLGVKGWTSLFDACLLYTSPSPRDRTRSRMPSSA